MEGGPLEMSKDRKKWKEKKIRGVGEKRPSCLRRSERILQNPCGHSDDGVHLLTMSFGLHDVNLMTYPNGHRALNRKQTLLEPWAHTAPVQPRPPSRRHTSGFASRCPDCNPRSPSSAEAESRQGCGKGSFSGGGTRG